MAIRNVPLAERRADVRNLDLELKEHRQNCTDCRPRQPCEVSRGLAAELAEAREDVKHWFDLGPDQGALL